MTDARPHPVKTPPRLALAALLAVLALTAALLAAPAAQAAPRVWDIGEDFAVSGAQQHNPQSDRYGSAGVWEFLHLHTTAEVVPVETSEFESLGQFGACFGAGTGFYTAGGCVTPGAAIGANRTAGPITTWEAIQESEAVAMYPGSEDWSILAWHSPITGTVELLTGLSSSSISHYSRWAVMKASAPGATATPIWAGEQFGTGTEVVGTEGMPLSVSAGEVIYVAVGPGEHNAWQHDETELLFTVEEAGGGSGGSGGGSGGGAPTPGSPAPTPAPPAPAPGLGTPLGKQLEADYGLFESKPAAITTTDVPVDFMPYRGKLKTKGVGGPLRIGDTGSNSDELRFWTVGEAQKYAAELTGGGVRAPASLRRKLCSGSAAACHKLKSNIVLALRPEKRGRIDSEIFEGLCRVEGCEANHKRVEAELEPFQIVNESPNPTEAAAWQGTTTEPVTVRLYYWDPALESKAKLPKPTPADPGPCGPLWDLAVSGWMPYNPGTIRLLNDYKAKGCHWKLDPKVVDKSTVAQPTIVGVGSQKQRTTVTLELWVPEAVPLTLTLSSFRGQVAAPGFMQDWKVAAGIQDEITVLVGGRGASVDAAGNAIGTFAGVDLAVYYDKPGGGHSSTPLATARTDSRGEAVLRFKPPATGTVRVMASGQPAAGPTLSGWASFPAVTPPKCFQSTNGLYWIRDDKAIYGGPREKKGDYMEGRLIGGKSYFFSGCSGSVAGASAANSTLCALLGWTHLFDCTQVGTAPARRTPVSSKAVEQPCASSQTTLGAPLQSDPKPATVTTTPVNADVEGHLYEAKTAKGANLGKDGTAQTTACKLIKGGIVPMANETAAGGLGTSISRALASNLISDKGLGVIAAGGGNVIAAGGGNVIAAGGGNVIAAGGGNVIAAGGGNVIAAGGGN